MSSITISGDTSGSVILQAPAVAGSTTLTLPTTTGTLVTSNAMPAGSVLQVVQTVINGQVSISGAAWNAVSGYSVSITPKSASNKILVIANTCYGTDAAGNYDVAFSIYRNASAITGAQGTASGSRLQATYSGDNRQQYGMSYAGATYLDSPASTSAQTYAIYAWVNGGTCYINREITNNNDAGSPLTISSITVMEVAG